MSLFGKKNRVMTVVNNDELHFVMFDHSGEWKILHSVALDDFLRDNNEMDYVPRAVKDRVNTLLIVPDYWVGNALYEFRSKKRSIIETFVERKLQVEHPDLPDIRYFCDHVFYETDQGERGLNVYFMQEPRFFHLYDQLAEFDLAPHRITSPAFLWEQKLSGIIPDFNKGEKGFVHMLSTEGLLYFFSRGHFLFSRSITLTESSDRLSSLTYEIDQSFRLVSQKTKAEIEHLYVSSPDEGDVQTLSEMLGRDVKDAGPLLREGPDIPEIEEYLGPVGFFDSNDLSPSGKFFSISHKVLKKELEWKPIQTAGIAIGLLLVLLLSTECFFLWKWPETSPFHASGPGITAETESKQIIQEYNNALDLLLKESDRPCPTEIIEKIARSLPENTWVKELSIEVETNPGVDFKGFIEASGFDQFKDSLGLLLANLNRHFQTRRPITTKDIDFGVDETSVEHGYQKYLIQFRFDLS